MQACSISKEAREQLREEIRSHLFSMREEAYQSFQSKLIPTVEKERILGVRTPLLRSYAKELYRREDIMIFLADLPHGYFEENQLHAFLISEEK
ncbi:MAG: hypothetical protein IIZ39_12220, partial [Blautia sp.]|nr:hypothetical protein [Blautia sp.]